MAARCAKTVRCHDTFCTRTTTIFLTVGTLQLLCLSRQTRLLCSPLTEAFAHLVRVRLAQISLGFEVQFPLRRTPVVLQRLFTIF